MPVSRSGERSRPVTSLSARVQLFATCLVDQFYSSVALAAIRLLDRLGVAVEAPRDLTCCGQPAFNGGFTNEARAKLDAWDEEVADISAMTSRRAYGATTPA